MIRIAAVGLMGLGLALAGTSAAGNWHEHPFYERARTEARLIPIRALGGAVKIEGDLADWDGMRQDSFVIHQLLDHTLPDFHQAWKGPWEHDPADAALVKLARDREALYVAIQVADDSIVSPATNRLGGDVVDLYLDLRPLAGDGPTLGHAKYTEGVYQIVCAPPSGREPAYSLQPEGEMWTGWRPGQKVPRLGPYEAKGSTFPGGYTLEMRIPLSSFPDKPAADRLAQPIGFEVMISDLDAARPQGRPERLFYSCSGYSGGRDYFKSPFMLACTDPDLPTALPLSRLRANPQKKAPGGDECEGWIVTTLDEKDVAAAFAAAGKAVPGHVEPAAKIARPITTYQCPALGLAFHHRRVLSRLPASAPACVGNRYAAVFPADGIRVKVDGDLGEWKDFEKTAAAIHEFGNLQACAALPGRTDSAQVKLMTTDDTLYVGVRVKDSSVFCPGGSANRVAGDAVEVFVDVRPVGGGLSGGSYGDGVYQFWLAPPTHDGQKAEFRQGPQKVRQAGPVELAGTKQKDGYALEMAIPLSSLLEKPLSGRFEQPFGFEAMVADADAGSEPLLTYSWGGFEEKALRSDPSCFSCADYLPNRLPETRALVDATPVSIAADFSATRQAVSGFGGNVFRDAAPTFHSPDGVDWAYALCSPSSMYVAENIQAAWIRANVELYPWGEIKGTPAVADGGLGDIMPARKLASVRYPFEYLISWTPLSGVKDVYQKLNIDWHLTLLKPFVRQDARVCFSAYNFPTGMFAKGSTTLERGKWQEFADCVTSYMAYARKHYGIEFACFALNPTADVPSFSKPEEYAEFLNFLGSQFENQGFKTRLMLCDASRFYDFRWYAALANDKEALKYVAAVGLQLSGSLDSQLATCRLWSDLARHMDRPLVITDFGRPYASSTTYLFDEVRLWHQLVDDVGAGAAIIRQFVSEKSSKWLMVYGADTAPGTERGMPVFRLKSWTKKEAEVVPTMRFWFAKHFCDLTPDGHAVAVDSDHPQVLATGFTGKRDGREAQTLHISNAGPARQAVISGLPDSVKALRIVRSGAGEAFHEAGEAQVNQGRVTLDLPAWSLVSLTTAPAPASELHPVAVAPAAALQSLPPPTEGSAWTNSLGMEFVRIAGLGVSFCRWESRVQDYQAFAGETKRDWQKPSFEQGPAHPAANVGWSDAKAFCEWLTAKERRSGKIGAKATYRLPTDAEWSVAVGLGPEVGNSPAERDSQVTGVYPWGKWPPAMNVLNCGVSEATGKVDPYDFTAPVGSFPMNPYGLYDMGGNVLEWCDDSYEPGKPWRVLRGGSFGYGNGTTLQSSFRFPYSSAARPDIGFRCVLAGATP